MISKHLNYESVANKIEVNKMREFKSCNFQYIFFDLDYLSYPWSKIYKILYMCS